MKNIVFVLFIALLFSCKSDSNQKSDSTKPAMEKKEVSRKDMGKNMDKKMPKKGQKSQEQLGMADNAENVLGGLKVGNIAPDFTLNDQNGNEVNLHRMLKEKEVALTFYRGSWCPHCTRQMSAFTSDIDKLKQSNIELIAISPETQDWSLEYTKTSDISFPILHDADHAVSKAYKGFFHVTDAYRESVMGGLEKDIASQNGDKTAMLNVPATYLIGKDRKIKYAFYDEDYSKRATIDDILAAAK